MSLSLAYSKASRTILVTYFFVNILVETASSGFGHQPKLVLNLGWVISASYTWSGGLVHSTPPYSPSVFCLKIMVSMRGSSKPAGVLRTKLSGLPENERQGRLQMSRSKCWRMVTIGL